MVDTATGSAIENAAPRLVITTTGSAIENAEAGIVVGQTEQVNLYSRFLQVCYNFNMYIQMMSIG
jgi:seryl-tRNA(Sec) selenium transferase